MLGAEIRSLRPLGVPIAIISNASPVWQAGVRADPAEADWVSPKGDAVDPGIWHAIDRPHPRLSLDAIPDGGRAFARDIAGTLVSETLIVAGVNDNPVHLDTAADGRLVAALYGDHTSYVRRPKRIGA